MNCKCYMDTNSDWNLMNTQEWEFDDLYDSKLCEICSDLLKLNLKFICLSFRKVVHVTFVLWLIDLVDFVGFPIYSKSSSFFPSKKQEDIWVFEF